MCKHILYVNLDGHIVCINCLAIIVNKNDTETQEG